MNGKYLLAAVLACGIVVTTEAAAVDRTGAQFQGESVIVRKITQDYDRFFLNKGVLCLGKDIAYHDPKSIVHTPIYDDTIYSKNGNMVASNFDNGVKSIHTFSSGYFTVRTEEGEVLYSPEGIQLTGTYSNITQLDEENKRFSAYTDQGYRLLDENGVALSSIAFDYIEEFSEGLAFASYNNSSTEGYIRTDGSVAFITSQRSNSGDSPSDGDIFYGGQFSEGLALAHMSSGAFIKLVVLDTKGNVVASRDEWSRYSEGVFSDGIVPVTIPITVEWGNRGTFRTTTTIYADTNLNQVIEGEYTSCGNFEHGIAFFNDGNYGHDYIDKNGTLLFTEYDDTHLHVNGYIGVEKMAAGVLWMSPHRS